MRLANRALFAALTILVLLAAANAQTPRPAEDPRNQSPAVGTGGPEGGPTGLFTIYDGSTIRKHEFTFSIAYSNYDRDPGNADFTDVVSSFNVGINDHIELFFKSLDYRGLKVNNPTMLSSFYLPNTGLCGSAVFCSGPAIILSPSGPSVGSLAGMALFRPFNNQPFVQFPFIGGSAGTFGQGPGGITLLFGFPGFNAAIGPAQGNHNGNNSPANAFPGLGSPVGSILPGIVLATTTLPATALSLPITIPSSFTIAPSYLPDAPFIGRLYGQSTWSNFVVGGKIRFTGPNNPLGIAIVPFYRWYADKADSLKGFTQLQRGASPGANFGDIGVVGVVDGRIAEHVNISANLGIIWNSNPKSKLIGGTILDRPNEFLSGIGLDFPINKHFQPVAEVRSTEYFGGQTPNALHNNPVDLVGGVKIYPRRWFGFGVAYRRHLNEQDSGHINHTDAIINVTQVTGVTVPGRGVVVVPGTSVSGTTGGVPNGFRFSDNPNGFILQAWAGHRNERGLPPVIPPPTVSPSASVTSITLPCEPPKTSATCPTTPPNMIVQLDANGHSESNTPLVYTWSVTGGKVTGEGGRVTWDLTGSGPGTYTASVTASDGTHQVPGTVTVTIAECPDCKVPCPTISVSGPSEVDQGQSITFTASASGGPSSGITYNWSVSAGTITSGQGTSSITVDTQNLGGQTVTATVELGGLDPSCAKTASASTAVKTPPPPPCTKFDEYGNIKFNDEKARLDNFAVQLQNQPGSTGYIIGYGSCEGEGLKRANRAKDYLVNTRNIDAARVVVIDGGCRAELLVQLYVCAQGAPPPTPMTDGAVSPCPECRPTRRAPRRHRGARHGKKKAGDDDDE